MRRGDFLTSLGSLIWVPGLLGAAGAPLAGSRTIDDIGPLIDYLRAARSIDDALQPARFLRLRTEIVPRSCSALGSDLGGATAQFLKGWVTLLYPVRERMGDLRDGLIGATDGYRTIFERRFSSGLPNYTAYLSASRLLFDAVAYSKDEYRLIFGVDKLAVDAIAPDHLALVAHHEMFHLLHAAVNRDFAGGMLEKSVAEALWFEGLACYASSLLHPGASLAQIVGSPDARAPSRQVLRRVQAALRSRKREDVARLFGMDERASSSLPFGAGYTVGYEVVRRHCEASDLDPASAARVPTGAVADLLDAGLSSPLGA
jgi:hypothetical protein